MIGQLIQRQIQKKTPPPAIFRDDTTKPSTSKPCTPKTMDQTLACKQISLDQNTYEATLLSILEKPITDTISPLLERVGTHIARMKTNNSSEKGILRFKTKGQDLVYQRRVTHRKPSHLASSPTKKKRANQTNKFRKGLGGSNSNDVRAQLGSDFKRQKKEIRSHILRESNVKVVVDTELALSMKRVFGT